MKKREKFRMCAIENKTNIGQGNFKRTFAHTCIRQVSRSTSPICFQKKSNFREPTCQLLRKLKDHRSKTVPLSPRLTIARQWMWKLTLKRQEPQSYRADKIGQNSSLLQKNGGTQRKGPREKPTRRSEWRSATPWNPRLTTRLRISKHLEKRKKRCLPRKRRKKTT